MPTAPDPGELKASGARLHGASDAQFQTICVLRT
jgi:hypothetical protein